MLKLKLIAHTPNPEEVVAKAAKLCYSPIGVEDMDVTPEQCAKFVNMLMSMGHESPIEHVTFTFAVEGISRACSHQIVRHRIASFSQQSQRYVELGQFEYIIPPEIESLPKAKEIFIEAMERDQKAYDILVDLLYDKHLKELMDSGVEENKAVRMAEKKAIEDARYVFPNACETKMVFTMNARTLYNFFHHRCCERAQWEIRELAEAMFKEVCEVAPSLFSKAGPSCVSGPCPEGKMSCGKVVEMRQKYNNIITEKGC